ncbi:hypothetical protein KBX53_01165 [Micromonospora sp. M51]|uniref:Uncharacterized protein n=1 Tax=Micromonospora parva TaxID=1464048 RepID=A0ABW6VRC9_9ACTN|nr:MULTISPECIES: hypothetical protein [unclassified Micromonospora]MBQ1009587.1 hypothetical protein [Micromonospora sp. M51]MBQ1030364.1 hypothetical protein [Micromonospora sp. C97]
MADHSGLPIAALLRGGPEDGPGELELGARQLALELAPYGERLPAPTEVAPDGTRAGEIEMIGAVALAIEPALPSIIAVLELLLAWAGQRQGRGVRIVEPDGSELDLTGVSAADQRRIAQTWLDRKLPR